jgi:hypothetical protein
MLPAFGTAKFSFSLADQIELPSTPEAVALNSFLRHSALSPPAAEIRAVDLVVIVLEVLLIALLANPRRGLEPSASRLSVLPEKSLSLWRLKPVSSFRSHFVQVVFVRPCMIRRTKTFQIRNVIIKRVMIFVMDVVSGRHFPVDGFPDGDMETQWLLSVPPHEVLSPDMVF